ncbi:MAG: hypothetical protein IT376_18465 [Polyangiaceae bacterium]|nr:hypothetical protein [Polyangiaceae bacterium]
MSDKIHNIVNTLLDGIHGISKSETIIGEPQRAGEATVIPVHRLKIAFGAAGAKADARGSRVGGGTGGHGAGGAVELDPVAAIAVGKDGTAHLLTVEADAGGTWAGLLEEVPELVTKIAHSLGERAVDVLQKKKLAPTAQPAGELAEAATKDS